MPQRRRVVRRRKRRLKKKWKVIFSLFTIMLLASGAYLFSVYADAKSTVNNKIHKQVASIDSKKTDKKISDEKPLNILLMGVDERQGDTGRSDALMILSVDPEHNRSQLISIPRDTRATMVGGDSAQEGTQDKINHAYAYGGADMSIRTVENLLDVDLDYYVKMNMKGVTEMVDAVGGVTVNNTIDWYDEGYYKKGYHYEKGDIHLDGAQALGYVRMRHEDPKGDVGRNERQRKVIKAIIDKGSSFQSVSRVSDMLDVLGNNMETNMDFATMKDLFMNYRSAQENLSTYQMTGTNSTVGGVYYYEVPDEELQKVHHMIKEYNS
ncbi:LCP family protein [Halobacillus salinarum]|uniref:LCP family protein n=1 Tax=Halobacillus salinarum TaxID=2932257 RepID=A0ABY4EU06_9BACI|nr:LCP family protein [Halobacillus salinarum]UOQ45611.1 LCP family protein [Halobacillus salinarum]